MAMRITCFIIALLVAAPALGQTPVFTNADLGKPRDWTSPLSPAEAAAILAPRQYVYVAPLPPGPRVTFIDSSPTAGPFGEFQPFSPFRRLDGSLMSEQPWFAYAPGNVWTQSYSLRDRGPRMTPGRSTPGRVRRSRE